MFYLNRVSLDYLTVTSFNPLVTQAVTRWAEVQARKADRGRHRMQYAGTLYHHERGTIYVGTGEQKGKEHHLIQISGLLADDAWPQVKKFIRGGTARVTRMDLQMTVSYEREHYDGALWAERLRNWHPHMSVSYIESKSGPAGSKLSTVYFGSRSSDRFVRLYEKMGLGEDVFLRFEVEYKSHRAQAVASHLIAKGEYESVFQAEVDRTQAKPLQRMFATDVPGQSPKLIKPTPATVKWLMEQVAPALDRVLNDHNIDSDGVRDHFLSILTNSLD